jgi:hypothetical protein
MPACCPSPVRVHYWVSTHPGPPSGSRCPAVRCPARPVSGYLAPSSGRGCPAGWCPARPASSRVVSSRVVSVRPPGRSRLVPRPPGGGDGEHLGTAGSGHDWIESSSMWSGPRPRRLGRRPEEHGRGHRCGVVCRSAGSVGRGLGRGVLGREAAADRPGRPDRREGRLSLATTLEQGGGWREVAARHRAGRPSGPGAATTLRGHCGG